MSVIVTYQFRCDRCGTRAMSDFTREQAAMHARKVEWRLAPSGDLCAKCARAVMQGAVA